MDRETLLGHMAAALGAIENSLFYKSERRFQGELLAELKKATPAEFLPGKASVGQEYQTHSESHGSEDPAGHHRSRVFDENRQNA